MVARKKYIIALVAIVVLLAVGLWNIKNGEIAFGTSLIGASVGVGVMRHIKERRIAKLRAQGLNPHDERTMHVAGLASTLTINIAIFTIAAIILVGSIIEPKPMVNLYDLLGFCLAGIVFIYIFAFYYYNRSN